MAKSIDIEKGEELGPFCKNYSTEFSSRYFIGLEDDTVHALIGFMDPVTHN